jgi:histidyl-tRNA synthetase
MGGQKTGACGFAVGIERILLSLEKTAPLAAPKAAVELFVASLGDAASKKAFVITDRIRAAGVATELGDRTKSLKSQMRSADKSGVRFVAIIGDDEVAKGMAAIRDMSTKEQTEVPFEGIAGLIKNKRG